MTQATIDLGARMNVAIKSYETTVTPTLATLLLAKNTNNRPVNKATVETYANAIKRGEWKMNGEAIRLSKTGRLLDGQHRLMAVISADEAISTYVIDGLDDDVFDTIDTGRNRKASDVFAIAGEPHATRLAAAARTIVLLRGADVNGKVTPAQCRQVLVDTPELRFWVNRYNSHKTLRKLIPSSIAALATLYARIHGTDLVEQFMDEVNSGIGLERGSPALTLRERFIDRARGQTFNSTLILAYCIKAMNAHVTGKKIAILRMTADEKFPEIAGDAKRAK